MEQLENRMITEWPESKTQKEMDDYNNYLLEQQDLNWEDIEC